MKNKLYGRAVALGQVDTIVFHLADGGDLALPVEGLEGDMELGLGRVCDISDINGEIHYFPLGNA